MNYSWDSIILDNFIKASQGNLEFVSKDGKVNEKTLEEWYEIQDNYIRVLELETIESKRYKAVCFKYAKALQEWILNPITTSKLNLEVNKLYNQKTKMAAEIFTNEKVDWDLMIAKVTNKAGQRVDSSVWKAKEFFNLIKAM